MVITIDSYAFLRFYVNGLTPMEFYYRYRRNRNKEYR